MKNPDIEKFFDLIKAANKTIFAVNDLKLDEQENNEIDYYLIKESILKEINQAFDGIILQLKKSIDEIETFKAESSERGDTNSVNILVEALEDTKKALINAETQKQDAISEVTKHYNPIIKVEHETTAFYSQPDYNGDEYVVSGNSKSSIVKFYPKSIRVAKGCSIKVFPYEDYRAHRSYNAPTFNKSTPANLPNNVNTGSMVSSPVQFRATSWKITCS